MDRLVYHGSVFMDNVHKVKISVHKVSFLKITVSYLRNSRGGTHPGRPAATQPAGAHVAAQPCRARCQDATPREQPAGGRCCRGPPGSTKPAPRLPGAWPPHHGRHPELAPAVGDPAAVTSSCPRPHPATAQKEPFGRFSVGSPLPAWPLQRSSFLACASGLTSLGKSSRGLASSDSPPRGSTLTLLSASHTHTGSQIHCSHLQQPVPSQTLGLATSQRRWGREGPRSPCCWLRSPPRIGDGPHRGSPGFGATCTPSHMRCAYNAPSVSVL